MPAKITPKQNLLVNNANYDALGDSAQTLSLDPRLSPEERMVLSRVHQLAVDRRLREEHPVLGRFISMVEGDGKPLSTKADWETLSPSGP